MNFALTDDHLALRDAVQRFCDGEYPPATRGDAEDAATAARRHAGLAALGLLGLTLEEAWGGSGQGPVETMLVMQEFGRALAAPGWLAEVVLAAPLLAEAGNPALADAWLPALVRGEARLALACTEPGSRLPLDRCATRAELHGSGWCLHGHKTLVLGGDVAHLLLVLARVGSPDASDDSAWALFAVPADTPGLQRQPVRTIDGRAAAHLRLDAVTLPASARLQPPGGARAAVERALARADAALCAESAGALDALLALCCEHLRTRRQFGQPLARFQALQHAVADMAMALEQLKSMACVAALATGLPQRAERERLLAAGRELTARLGRESALAAIQLHGAMGMTDECRVGHYAKRLIANGLLLGDASAQLQRFQAHRSPTPDP